MAPEAPVDTESAGGSAAPAAAATGDDSPAGSTEGTAEGGEAAGDPALGAEDEGSPPEMPTPDPGDLDDGAGSGVSSSSSEDATDGAPAGGTDTAGSSASAGVTRGSPNDAVAAAPEDAVAISSDDAVAVSRDDVPPPPPPPPAADNRPRGPVYIDDVQFLVREKFPMSVAVLISGELPTPCHEVGWEVTVSGSTHDVTVWSVESPEEIACATVMEPFTAQVELGDDFLFEDYTVVVNGTAYPLNF